MKFSTSLALALLPFLAQVSAVQVPGPAIIARQDGNRQQGNNKKGGKSGGNNNNNGGNSNNSNGGGADAQTSLTLDPAVIAEGFSNDGQDVPSAGQVPSLTSTNNFINFCLTVPDLPITNGKQVTTGSCNPAPIGAIPSVDQMPSSKFTVPKNGEVIAADTPFTITMAIKNLETGVFVNAQTNYFSAPQQLNGQGTIIGHSHVVIEELDSLEQTAPTDPKKFAFFKGLNGAAQGGVLTADVTSGIPAGAYRLCSINAAANHQPVIVPVAQHGALDDCVYFTATAGGAGNNNGGNNNNNDNNNDVADDTANDAGAGAGADADTGAGADAGADTGAGTGAGAGAGSGGQNGGGRNGGGRNRGGNRGGNQGGNRNGGGRNGGRNSRRRFLHEY